MLIMDECRVVATSFSHCDGSVGSDLEKHIPADIVDRA